MKIIITISIIVIIYFPFTIKSDNLKIFKFIFSLHFLIMLGSNENYHLYLLNLQMVIGSNQRINQIQEFG